MKTKLKKAIDALGLARALAALSVLMLVVGLQGCASGPQAVAHDPLEPLNRQVYAFNDTVDKALLKPVAQAYTDVVPSLVRRGVSNFFSNLGDVWTFVNTLLQGKPQAAAETLMRFGMNSVFGLGGLFDVASELGMPKHKEDFGQTLGRWGVPAGPYLVLPILGPSNLRDASALTADLQVDPLNQFKPKEAQLGLGVLKVTDTRAKLLQLGGLVDRASLDPYGFVRDAYLQKRRNDVYDGDPPPEPQQPSEEPWLDEEQKPAASGADVVEPVEKEPVSNADARP